MRSVARLPAALLAASLATPASAAAEGVPRGAGAGIVGGEDERDAEIFGAEGDAPADAREGAVFGDSEAERDDAIFGADDGDATIFGAENTGGADRDAEIFGARADRDEAIFGAAPSDRPEPPPAAGGLLSGAEIDRRLGKAQNKLDIGGLLYLRGTWTLSDDQRAEDAPLSSPNLFDLYLDARPSDDLRVFARGRLTHHFADPVLALPTAAAQERTSAALDQLWLKFDVDDLLFVTVGRQPIKWGAGRFWNPTDFLNRTVRDPLAVFDERLGVAAVKLHLPVERSGWNFYAVASFDDAASPGQVGGAFRIEKLIGDTETSLSAALRKGDPIRLGADVSFPLWLFDVRAELALLHGDESRYWEGVPDWSSATPLAGVRPLSREDEWIPQAVLGAEIDIPYGDDDHFTLGAEYFYNGAGYDDPRIYPLLLATGSYTPLYAGEHYAGFYATAMGPFRWNDTTLIASLLGNLSDGSWLGRFDYRVRLLTYLDLNSWAAWHFGGPGEFRLGMDLPGIPGAADLTDEDWERLGIPDPLRPLLAGGASIPAQRFELGAGLSLRF